MSDDIWQNINKVILEEPLSFVDYPYDSPFLDMHDFLIRHPQLAGRIPEYVEVKPPANADLNTLYYSVAYISSSDHLSGVLVLFFIDRYDSQFPRLWIDKNLNRDFRDDGGAIVFERSMQRVDVVLKHSDENALSFNFTVIGPIVGEEYKADLVKEPDLEESVSKSRGKRGRGIPKWLAFNFDIGYGLGRVQYGFNSRTTGYPTDYRVTSNHKGFRAGLGLRAGAFRFVPTVGFNHFFYWTSYKVVRLGEPYVFCDPNCTRFENVEELRNRDIHPQLRWDFGMQIAWEPFVTKDLRIGPFIEPQLWRFSKGVYYEKYLQDFVAYPYQQSAALRLGLSLWVKAGERSYFRVEFSGAWSRFQPSGFFDDVDPLYDQQRSLGLHLGYGF